MDHEPSETLSELLASANIREAIAAYEANEEGWRGKWGLILATMQLRAAQGIGSESLSLDLHSEFVKFFGIINAAILDAGRGVEHPLTKPMKLSHRPPATSKQVDRMVALSILAMVELEIGQTQKRSREMSFRAVSQNLRRWKIDITWKEVRSAWHNRARETSVLAILNDTESKFKGKMSEERLGKLYELQSRKLTKKN